MSHPAPASSHPAGSEALTRSQIVAWRNAVFVIFALSGIGMASWVARTPSIRDALGASTFEMGLIVFGLAAGSIVGLTTSSHVLARIGSAATIRASVIGAGHRSRADRHRRVRDHAARWSSPAWRSSGSASGCATSR